MTNPIMLSDRTDISRILDILQKDGRISNIKLAEAVNLVAYTGLARVRKADQRSLYLGYEAKPVRTCSTKVLWCL